MDAVRAQTNLSGWVAAAQGCTAYTGYTVMAIVARASLDITSLVILSSHRLPGLRLCHVYCTMKYLFGSSWRKLKTPKFVGVLASSS